MSKFMQMDTDGILGQELSVYPKGRLILHQAVAWCEENGFFIWIDYDIVDGAWVQIVSLIKEHPIHTEISPTFRDALIAAVEKAKKETEGK